ncbi:hypothetical protein OIU76_015946 [Salix suchowensis]|nr:hypothetical protein OIU76_015946 [Salix suchowensis]
MAADRVPNEHNFNSKLPSHNHTNFGRNRGRNWNQGRGSRRTGQWEQAQKNWPSNQHPQHRGWPSNQHPHHREWPPNQHSQHCAPQSTTIPSHPTLSDGRPPLLPTPQNSPSKFLQNGVVCFRCDKAGHIARFCPERQPHAYVAENAATSAPLTDDVAQLNWCLDSGATHHMTANPSSLPRCPSIYSAV